MDKQGPISKALESPAIVIVGSVADVAAVFVLLNSGTVLSWARNNPRTTILALASIVLLCLALLNAWLQSRGVARRNRETIEELRLQASEVDRRNRETIEALRLEPSSQDIARFREFWQDFGVESPLHVWLKHGYFVDKAFYRELRALDAVVDKWDRDPTNYNDPELAEAFTRLSESLSKMRNSTAQYYFAADSSPLGDSTLFMVPREWEHVQKEQWKAAFDTLETVHDEVMSSYVNFLNMAQKKQVRFAQ